MGLSKGNELDILDNKNNDNFMIYVSMNIKDNQLQQKDSSMLLDQ